MKVIDLLNKIAKGEEVPKKIKINDDELYFSKYKNDYIFEDGGDLNWCYYVRKKSLNDEIEIIEEEKEIEELDKIELTKIYCEYLENNFTAPMFNLISDIETICNETNDKINELVREVNKIKKEGK